MVGVVIGRFMCHRLLVRLQSFNDIRLVGAADLPRQMFITNLNIVNCLKAQFSRQPGKVISWQRDVKSQWTGFMNIMPAMSAELHRALRTRDTDVHADLADGRNSEALGLRTNSRPAWRDAAVEVIG